MDSAQDDIPILFFNQLAKLLWTFAGGIESAHQTAHAGAREIVDGDVMVFKPLQYSDVRQSERSTAFQGHANFQPRPGGLRGWLRRGRSRRCNRGEPASPAPEKKGQATTGKRVRAGYRACKAPFELLARTQAWVTNKFRPG